MVEILFGVLQSLIPGPILFNIFLSDLFLVINDVNFAIYADDNTTYDSEERTDNVMTSIQESTKRIFWWPSYNRLKRNTNKFHYGY